MGSQFWEAEFSRGTFDQMDETRRETICAIFSQANRMVRLQQQIWDGQAGFKVLALSLDISANERLRYYDLLARVKTDSSILELIAG